MNPELYERYLQKKAKRLGISVDELKNGNKPENSNNQVEQTVNNSAYSVFGPSKIEDIKSEPMNETNIPKFEDTREDKFALIGYPLGHSLSKVIHEAGF